MFVCNSRLKKEGYSQEEIDLFFKAVVLSKLVYGLSVYGASTADLNIIQCILDRCSRRHYTSELFNIQELLEKHDRRLLLKIKRNSCHPLYSLAPQG